MPEKRPTDPVSLDDDVEDSESCPVRINMNVEMQDVVGVCSECCCWFYGEYVVFGTARVA